MDISNNNTDQPIPTLNNRIQDFDVLLDSFVNLPSDEIISSKKEVLITVKHFIEDTFKDLISLKINFGEKDAKFIDAINNVYSRVFKGVFLTYNEEFLELKNSKLHPLVALKIRFTPYVYLLDKAVKNISNYDCHIRSRINSFNDVVMINNRELENYKKRLKSVSFRQSVINLLSSNEIPINEISLIDFNEEKKQLKKPRSSKPIRYW